MIGLLLALALATQPSFETVVAALSDPSVDVRLDAVGKLQAAGYPEAIGPVAARAVDPDPRVQRAALAAVVALALPGQGASDAFDQERVPSVPIPAAAFGPLAAAMGDAAAPVRVEAAYAFAVLAGRPPAGVPADAMSVVSHALAAMLASGQRDLRVAAGRVAGRLYRAGRAAVPPAGPLPQELLDALVRQMNRADELEELVAMQSLGFAREPRAYVALADRYGFHAGQGNRLRAAGALDALAHLALPESAPLFERLLDEGTPLEQRLAIDGLARLGDPGRLSRILAAAAEARDNQVRMAALFAREYLLGDGSGVGGLRAEVGDRRLGSQARDYLRELGLEP
ncbi:MAG: hypothetical protein AB7O67_10465 [Vicinamibacterales bacterium]